MPDDIFDITDISDLPPDFFKSRRHSKYVDLIAQAGRPVSVKELKVAIFRKSGKKVGPVVATSCGVLARAGRLRRVAHGVYALPEKD